jgi:putative phosphoribosyl transferase
MRIVFDDRAEAGVFLASKLRKYANRVDVVVLGLPRGGVPVAYPIAQALNAPLDVFLVRKLGVPGQEELAMGAIAMGGVKLINQSIASAMSISKEQIDAVVAQEEMELARRERLYRHDRGPLDVTGRTVILVDDGLATGASMWAAVTALRRLEPGKIIVAVPVGSETTCNALRHEVDEMICGITPDPFIAVGAWYENFSQTTDEEVCNLLDHAIRPFAWQG